MRLPIPIFTNSGNVYTDAEIIKPRPSVLADTQKVLRSEGIYSAIKVFISGCVEELKDESGENIITDKMAIKNVIPKMPYRSAEALMLDIMVLYDPDNDYVEGVYECPRCHNPIVCERIQTDEYEIDTRDLISDLDRMNMEDIKETFSIVLSEPVLIKNASTGDILESVESFELRHPTLIDCIIADKKYGSSDDIRTQFAVYVESLQKVNGNPVDKSYKSKYGMLIFENIKDAKNDIGALNEEISRYGINPLTEKTCQNPKCGKVWKVPLNMSNFFASGLTL